jgi:hypothetical protein
MAKYNTPTVNAWIRAEHLRADIENTFAEFITDANSVGALIQHRNAKLATAQDWRFYFTKDDVEAIYQANPQWSRIEEKLYGSLLIEDF